MLIQPTFFEALLLQRPDIEKIVKKDYQISKKNIKKRLQLCDSLEQRIEVLEEAISSIEQIWEKEGVMFMIKVLDTPMDKINRGEYQFRIERAIDLNDAILNDSPFFYPQNLSKLDGGFTVREDFNLIFPHFAIKAYSYKKPDGFFTTVAEIKYFRLCIFFLRRKLSNCKEELAKSESIEGLFLKLRVATRKRIDSQTSLTARQTGLFARYMNKSQIFLKEVENVDVGKAFQHLTSYSHNTIRHSFGSQDLHYFKIEEYQKVQTILQNMLNAIETDMKSIG